MTDKEFKRLSRPQLIEIIYQLQVQQEELIAENQKLKDALADKQIWMREANNLAEAVLSINNVMQSAQDAAEQYLAEIRRMHAEVMQECRDVRENTNQEADLVKAKNRNMLLKSSWMNARKKVNEHERKEPQKLFASDNRSD